MYVTCNSLFALGVDSIITDRVQDFRPDGKEKFNEVKSQAEVEIETAVAKVHCIGCLGPYEYDKELAEQKALSNKSSAAKSYVADLTACRVTVPYPASTIDYEKTIMESRRALVAAAAAAAAGAMAKPSDSSHASFLHTTPEIVLSCEKCEAT